MTSAYREFAPGARLARYVECYWARDDSGGGTHSVLPDGCADIIFTTKNREPLDLQVVGLMTKPLPVEPMGGRSYFGVRFRPGMAAAFLPEAADLNDRVEPLESLWGASAQKLSERLAEVTDMTQRTMIAEQYLRPLEPPDSPCRVLWQLSNTTLPLQQLLADAGLSERHFRRECARRTGVSPKYLERILRFRRTVQRIHAIAERSAHSVQPSWVQLGAAGGYYDQAHFIRDFQEFAGCTPGRFLQSLRATVGVESKNDEPTETGKSNRLY